MTSLSVDQMTPCLSADDHTQSPLFLAQSSIGRDLTRRYSALIRADARTLRGALRYGVYHVLGSAGHFITFCEMALIEEKPVASMRAYDDHVLVHDPFLKTLAECPKSLMAMIDKDYIDGGYRKVDDRMADIDGKRWFRFAYDEVNAAFYSDDIVVLRFCWGDFIDATWDMLLCSEDFVKGTADEFIMFAEPFYKQKRTSGSPEHEERWTNYWANPKTVGKQRMVRIYDRRKKWWLKIKEIAAKLKADSRLPRW